MRLLAVLTLLGLAAAAAPEKPKKLTPQDVIDAAPAAAWRTIAPGDLLVITLDGGKRVVVQLAPAFAPVHVANIRKMASSPYWQGAAVYRVQDNYVAQWGLGDKERKPPAGVVERPPHEYWRARAGLRIRPLGSRDSYAPAAGYARGWPVAYSPAAKTANLTHCYGSVGVARGLHPDTGSGSELYAIIGHAPRQLDRNIAVVGRVIEGIEQLAALPRGTERLGFYKEGTVARPISAMTLASLLPAGERPAYQYLDERSAAFSRYLRLRANRDDDFYRVAAGGVDLCNAPVPVRPVPANKG